MSYMKPHISVEGYSGSLKELAHAIGSMRYDKVAEFLAEFTKELEQQSEGDAKRGHAQLAALLKSTSEQIGMTQVQMEKIWKLCEPYMQND